MIVDVDIEAAVAAQKLRNEEQARGRGSIRISALSRSTDNVDPIHVQSYLKGGYIKLHDADCIHVFPQYP